ncbi:hypothetical protein [Caulobacter soli]|uniref:hypothetical protein n=1 Tax=Caulobacter soli TaxID=2708539 RepID=UPI0013EA627D|nr:hypothetical protein [Caulobacter soli]
MGHFHRKVWHRFAKLEDYDMWCDGQATHPDRRTRRRAILARMNAWFAAAIAEKTKARGGV